MKSTNGGSSGITWKDPTISAVGDGNDLTASAVCGGNDPTVSAVGIKTPPFYRTCPEAWFRRMEAQFYLSKVVSETTKYYHAIAALPEDIANLVIFDEKPDYKMLKARVIDSLTANKHQLIEEALSGLELGDKRPSQMLVEIQRKFASININPDQTIIKSRLIAALPANIRAALVGHEELEAEKFARVADSMLAVAPKTTPYAVMTATSERSSQRRPENGYKYQVRPFHENQRPKICNAHIFYGKAARNCRQWCQWPQKGNATIIEANRQTPNQSRSGSPTKNE